MKTKFKVKKPSQRRHQVEDEVIDTDEPVKAKKFHFKKKRRPVEDDDSGPKRSWHVNEEDDDEDSRGEHPVRTSNQLIALQDLDDDKVYGIWTQPLREFGTRYKPASGGEIKGHSEEAFDYGAVRRFPNDKLPRGAWLTPIYCKWGTGYVQLTKWDGKYTPPPNARQAPAKPRRRIKIGKKLTRMQKWFRNLKR